MELTTAIMKLLKFVGSMYCPKRVNVTNISDLQLYLICKQLAESNKLRPTLGALEEHIKHVRVRCQVTIMQQQPFNLLKFGFYKDDVVRYRQSLRRFFLHHKPSSSSSDGVVKPTATSTFLQANTQSFTWIPHSYTLQMP